MGFVVVIFIFILRLSDRWMLFLCWIVIFVCVWLCCM